MTLNIKHFINPEMSTKEYAVIVTDGIKKKDDDGKKVLRYEMTFIKSKDFTKYELYPEGASSKTIIPTVKLK